MTIFRYLFRLIIFLFCICVQFALADKPEVKIGVIAPLSGGLSNRGQDMARMAEILEPYFNSLSSTYRYSFLVDDGKCGFGNAPTTIATKYIHIDKVKFMITGCSGETLQVGPIAERSKVLIFAVLSTHQDVKHLGSYIFRTFVDIERAVEHFAKYIAKKDKGRIALLTEENAFTFGIKELLEKYLGKQLIFSEDYPAGEADFTTLLTKLKAAKPEGIYFNALSEHTLAILVNQSRALGISQPLYSYNMPEAPSFVEATGKNSEGLEFIGAPDVTKASPEFDALLATYVKRHPEGPSYEFLLRTFYDATRSIFDAVEKVGPDATKARDFLATYQTVGALGAISYDENGDVSDINYFLRRIENGKNVAIRDLTKGEAAAN